MLSFFLSHSVCVGWGVTLVPVDVLQQSVRACMRVAIVTSGLRNRCYVGPSAVLPSKSLLAFTRKDVSKVEGLFAIQKNVGARTAWSVATSRTDPADDERHFDLALITPCPHQSTPVTISARRRARPNDRTDGGVGCASLRLVVQLRTSGSHHLRKFRLAILRRSLPRVRNDVMTAMACRDDVTAVGIRH